MANLTFFDIVPLAVWLLASIISLYFSIGNARIWTSISTGFFLIFVNQAYLVAPWVNTPRLAALHSIVGTVAVMVLTHGFQEYYVFSRTLEATGRKSVIFIMTAAVILASAGFLVANPTPSPAVLRHIRLIENSNWVFLSLINLDMIRKILIQVKGTDIARGFIAFSFVFVSIFIWRGSELYLQVYGWDTQWLSALATHGAQMSSADLARIAFSLEVHRVAELTSSISVAATFLYLFKLLR